MNIQDQLQSDGIALKKVSSTNGGEYCSPCPVCGGRDRFRVWINQGDTGRYWCRQCGITGDLLQYLIDFKNMTFFEACQYSGNDHKINNGGPCRSEIIKSRDQWEPKEISPPPDMWQERASLLIKFAQETLFSKIGQRCRTWLYTQRCLTDETIEKFHLGLLPKYYYRERSQWGLPDEINPKTGKNKKICLPRGLVIPYVQGGQVLRLRIRLPDPGKYSKYQNVFGSKNYPFYNTLSEGTDVVIVESDLDAILLNQVLGPDVTPIALGSATNKPDTILMGFLRNHARHILIALDTDSAGGKPCYQFWKKYFPKSSRCIIPSRFGKDPTEAALHGLNLRQWFQAGIKIAKI
ncbi:MAG: hypothetical protein KKE62_01710 [Proteobacteria bacterium]|nr:hypothetical protein [Pseudomonadota bacterium]MBU1387146.1 hypothetical protein [Pseudomonadota bacterium]MBU1541537.1 hypothetical protein [Pseudomonadota bacterium]MBU2481842.1 hypothetical protein [Pseudomonadota bacterium]